MSLYLVILAVLIGAISFGVGGYLSYRSYAMARDAFLEKIERAKAELIHDINEIGVEELKQTTAGKELLGMLSSEEISNWHNLGYRHFALETARYYEGRSIERSRRDSLKSQNSDANHHFAGARR
jgi:hypothetical protein